MEVIKIYENYGVLGAEKRSFFTYGVPAETAVGADEIEIEIPEGWEIYELEIGGIAIKDHFGRPHFINDILGCKNNDPVFVTFDKKGKDIVVPLKRVNAERSIQKKPKKAR